MDGPHHLGLVAIMGTCTNSKHHGAQGRAHEQEDGMS